MNIDDLLRQLAQLRQEFKALQTRDKLYYVEGTFTPTLVGSGTAGTYTGTTGTGGNYTQIGNRVFVSGRVVFTGTTTAPTGSMAIGGLPFTAVSAAGSVIAGGMTIFNWSGFNVPAGYTQVEAQILTSGVKAGIVRNGGNIAPAYVDGAEVAAACDVQFFGVYQV
jgi:hypothetical protein